MIQSLGQEDPLEEGVLGNPLQYSCPKNLRTEEPEGYSSLGHKE